LLSDSLTLIAEFSIGLAGFSGIVALIGSTADRVHKIRVTILLRTSFTPGFCALFGIFLLHLGLDSDSAARWTGALFGVVIAFQYAFGLQAIWQTESSLRKQMYRPIFWIHLVAYPVNFLLQFYNAFVPNNYAEAILIGGLVHILLVGATSFTKIVVQILKNRPES
jgi:hypothetical protein